MNNRQTKGVSDQVRDEAETERQRERGRLDEVHPLWREGNLLYSKIY